MRNDGKSAEKFVQNLFTKSGFHVERLKDTRDAGRKMAGNVADMVIGRSLILFYVEVKSTVKKYFYKGGLTGVQLQRNMLACRKGICGIYVITTNEGEDIVFYEWTQILLFFASDTRTNIVQAVKPIYTMSLSEPFDSKIRIPAKIILPRIIQTHKDLRQEFLETSFDFKIKKKYRRLKL